MATPRQTILLCATLTAAFFFTVFPATGAQQADTSNQAQTVRIPPVTLKDWQESPKGERFAFLIGFLSFLEEERAWQGAKALPVGKSTVGVWFKGLSDVPLRDMTATVDAYIAEHPDKMNKSVLEVLGRAYVRPNLSKEEKKIAESHYKKLKK